MELAVASRAEALRTIYGAQISALNDKARNAGWLSRCDPTLSFREPKLKQLLALWQKVAIGERLPARAEFTARMLLPYLPNISITEVVALPDGGHSGENYVQLLVGTALVRTLSESTGKTLFATMPPKLLPRTLAFADIIRETRRPVRIITRVQITQSDYLCGEILGFPLADDHETLNKLLTASYFSPAIDSCLMEEIGSL